MTVPSNAQYASGIGVVSGDQLNTFVQTCPTSSALRSFVGAANMTVTLLGISAANDGNGGGFYWSTTSTAADDNLNVIRPSGTTVGAWLRVTSITTFQTVTLSGDVTGSGTTAITTTLATVNTNVGVYQGLTINAKGLITAATTAGAVQGATVAASTSVATPLYTTSAAALVAQPPAVAGIGATGYATTVAGGNASTLGYGGNLTLIGGSATSGFSPNGSSLVLQGYQTGGNPTATLTTGGSGAGNFIVTAGTLALTGALRVSSTTVLSSGLTGTTGAFSSTISGTAITGSAYRNTGNIVQSGTSTVNTNGFAYWTPSFTGSLGAPQGYSGLYIAPNEAVNYYGPNSWNMAFFTQSLGGAGSAGARTGHHVQLVRPAASDPGDPTTRADTAIIARANATVRNGGRQMSSLTDGSGPIGGVYGMVSQATLGGTALYYGSLEGIEVDISIAAGASAKNKVGLLISNLDTDVKRGDLSDVGLLFGVQVGTVVAGWKTGIGFGRETSDPASGTDSTLLKTTQRRYGGVNTVPFLRGVDFTEATITSGGFAFASPNFGADDTGALYANGVQTTGTVQAQTATVTGTTITAGEYHLDAATKPVYVVSPPPSGVTATMTTNVMVGVNIRAFGSTGKNYLVGDVLTVPSSVGANPTVTVATVDAQGGVQTVTVTTNGAVTKAQTNPVLLTGGTGTGASFHIEYTASGATFVPGTFFPAATGSDHVVADVLTIVGDTGTAVKFNVAMVDAFGGVVTVTLNTAGSVTVVGGTAIGADNFHTATTTGVGLGGRFGVTYGVSTVTITNAGSGYLPKPPPYVRCSQSTYITAEVIPVLTAAAAALALNPSGGLVQLGGSTTVAGLGTAGTAGRRSIVTDATVTTFASVVVGGGANKVPVYDDGTNWRIG